MVVRSLKYLFKFIVRSQKLYKTLGDSDPATYFVHDISFESLVEGFFCSIQRLLNEKGQSLTAHAAVFQNLPATLDELVHVIAPDLLAQQMVAIMRQIGFIPGESRYDEQQLIEKRVVFFNLSVNSVVFTDFPDCQKIILEELVAQLNSMLELNIEAAATAALIGDIICACENNSVSQKVILAQLLRPLMKRFVKSVETGTLDESSKESTQHLFSTIVTVLNWLSQDLYQYLIDSVTENEGSNHFHLKQFLMQLYEFIQISAQCDFSIPKEWVQLSIQSAATILNCIRMTSLTLYSYFQSKSEFNFELWKSFFNISIFFLSQPILQIEEKVFIKRLKMKLIYGDMRLQVATLVKEMWNNLGRNKQDFITHEAQDVLQNFLRMSLVPVKSLREETLPIFYDMINFEVATSKNATFPIVEHAVISSLDKHFSDGLGDQQYVELFVNILSSWCQRNQKLQALGLDFVRKVNIFMNLLLEFRANVSKDQIDAMIVIEKLLKFYRNELNRDDLYIDYLYKLYKIHKETNNFAEAAFVLLEHADRLSWEPRSLSISNYCSSVVLKYQNCHTERDLKEELYEEIIELLDKGKMWEEAIRCSKEIEKEYEENQLDYVSLAERLEMRSRLSRKIVDKSVVRIPSPYFFVGYFGHGWPEQYSNRMFIYRGNEFELRDDLIDTIQSRYPKSKVMNNTKPPDPHIKQSIEQHLQVYEVKPVGNIPAQFKEKPVPPKILQYYMCNETSNFKYDRRFHQGTRLVNNEHATMWIERRIYRTAGRFPGILRWYEVEDTNTETLSPLENAIAIVESRNAELTAMVKEYSQDVEQFQQLTQTLKGTVDPAVSRGFSNYEEAFFSAAFAQNATAAEYKQINRLKDLMAEQIPILEKLMVLHGNLVDTYQPTLAPLHDDLTSIFHKLKADVEEKYGRRTISSSLQRLPTSINRRESRLRRKSTVDASRVSVEDNSSGSGSRPGSAYQDMPEIPMKTLPKKKVARSDSKIASLKKSRRQSRPTEWLVDKTDNIRETLNKTAQELRRQISSDSFRSKSPERIIKPTFNFSSTVELREHATPMRPRRPKSQSRSRPESWAESENSTLKIYSPPLSPDEPPPLPLKKAPEKPPKPPKKI